MAEVWMRQLPNCLMTVTFGNEELNGQLLVTIFSNETEITSYFSTKQHIDAFRERLIGADYRLTSEDKP